MPTELVWLCLLFFLTAATYAAAGFGGGSTYLAILSFAVTDFGSVRTLALLCNLVVVTASVAYFLRKRTLPRKVVPLTMASVPAAFLAALVQLTESAFFIALGATLVIAAAAMLCQRVEQTQQASRLSSRWHDPMLGAGVGALAGLVGIGGGIFLAPILHLTRWDAPRAIAASASFFILVNSVAGLAGLLTSGQLRIADPYHLWLLVAVGLGGQVGVRFGLSQPATGRIRSVTAVVVLAAGIRILVTHLGNMAG